MSFLTSLVAFPFTVTLQLFSAARGSSLAASNHFVACWLLVAALHVKCVTAAFARLVEICLHGMVSTNNYFGQTPDRRILGLEQNTLAACTACLAHTILDRHQTALNESWSRLVSDTLVACTACLHSNFGQTPDSVQQLNRYFCRGTSSSDLHRQFWTDTRPRPLRTLKSTSEGSLTELL